MHSTDLVFRKKNGKKKAMSGVCIFPRLGTQQRFRRSIYMQEATKTYAAHYPENTVHIVKYVNIFNKELEAN